jgi:hypothetical protein
MSILRPGDRDGIKVQNPDSPAMRRAQKGRR